MAIEALNCSEKPNGSLISRQAAIEALGEEPEIWNDTEEEWAYRNAWVEHISAIKALPSAEPKTKCIAQIRIDRDDMEDLINEKVNEIVDRMTEPKTGECRTCKRNADNGGVYEDGRTKCPIQEHYALLLDGYCHLYEQI